MSHEPDRCISELVPQAAIDAAVLAASNPVHDDGHTDCYYAGILLAAWPHLTRGPGVHPDDLLTSSDVRQQCGGITRHTFIRWRATRGFPEPIARLKVGRGKNAQYTEIWDRRDVRAWLEANPLQ